MPLPILLFDLRLALIGSLYQYTLRFGDNHIRKTDSRTEECRILESYIFYGVKHAHSNRSLLILNNLSHETLEFLISETDVLERDLRWHLGVEQHSSSSGLNDRTIGETIGDQSIVRERSCFNG